MGDGEDVDVGKHENIRSTGHRTRRPCFQRRPVAVPASETIWTFRARCFCERLNIAGFPAPVAARDNLSDWLRGRHLLRAAAAECRKILPSMVQDCQIEALKTRQNDPPISLSLNSRIRTLRGSVSECISYLFFFCFCVFWSWKHCFSFWLFVCFSILSFRLFELRFRSMSLCFLSSRFPCRFRSGSRAVRPLDSVANCSPSAPRLWNRISKRLRWTLKCL